jgi:hypothetical protein
MTLPSEQIEAFLRANRNPYDLLLEAQAASLLDLGAGDLSFADDLLSQYGPRLRARQKTLILHCVDRLRPGSRLGGRLHADQDRLRKLQQAGPGFAFRFWGDQDMFALANVKGLLPRYTLVTCHGPATPTFAYEPSRVAGPVIEAHLRNTKGGFRPVRVEGEPALEVLHGGRALLFPPWKFEIRGPLALLDLMARRGLAIVLGAVDTEVFWEILAQLVDEDRVRPRDVVFTPANVPEIFGPLYAALSSLPIGKGMALDQVAPLRRTIPRVSADREPPGPTYRFRYVEVRRGATFDGLPASQTARLFKDMPEETPPWMIILVPEEIRN